MTNFNAFGSCSSTCNGSAAAASFDARMIMIMDTVIALAVSICILALDVRLYLLPA